MMNGKKIAAATFALTLVLAGAGCGASSSGDATSADAATEDSASQQVANPWVEVGSLVEAAELAGFDLTVPESIQGYDGFSIQVMEGQIIEVTYTDSDSGNEVCIRKGSSDIDDISGDHNYYAEMSQVSVGSRSVGLMGNDGTVSLAGWYEGDYVYSVGAYGEALSTEAMEEVISEIL